jgi:hypothetical protein
MSEKINLDNCEFTLKGKRLNSARSLEAIKIIGADENDLIKLTLAQYLKKFPEARGIKKELQEERLEHYEEQRQKLLDEIKKVRNDLIKNDVDNNNNNNTTNDVNKIIDNNENNDVFVDKEEVEEDNLRKNKPEEKKEEEKKDENEKNEEKKDENEKKDEKKENEEKKRRK